LFKTGAMADLLYDLTSTYFECDVTEEPNGLRRFGYSRDKRSGGVQVVIALVGTPEGIPAEESLERMRQQGANCLVGTPRADGSASSKSRKKKCSEDL